MKNISLKSVFESHIIDGGISNIEAKNIARQIGLNFDKELFSFQDFVDGANHEIEHKNIVAMSPSKIARIALDHLREDPKYYKKLNKIHESFGSMNLMKIFESIIEDNKKGKMVAIFLPEDLGLNLQSIFEETPGEAVPPNDMHITLGLIGDEISNDRKIVSILGDLAQSFDPFDVKIDGFGKFDPHKENHMKHVLWAKPSSNSIDHLHDMTFDLFKKHRLPIDNGSFEFKPHITLKYCDKEPEITKKIDNPIFRAKNISFASGGDKYHIPLGKRRYR